LIVDLLDETRNQIAERLNELRPAVDEFGRLQQAVAALEGMDGAAPVQPPRRRPGRPPGRKTTTTQAVPVSTQEAPKQEAAPTRTRTRRRRARGAGRPRGSGGRSAQALVLIEQYPGLTVAELAARMGIHRTYMYKVVPALQKEAKIEKDGRGWRVAAGTAGS
jgi:hypothetical protein